MAVRYVFKVSNGIELESLNEILIQTGANPGFKIINLGKGARYVDITFFDPTSGEIRPWDEDSVPGGDKTPYFYIPLLDETLPELCFRPAVFVGSPSEISKLETDLRSKFDLQLYREIET